MRRKTGGLARATHRDERKAFPDMQFAVNHIVVEGDLVVVHWTAWGTNTQPGMGFPATGKRAKVSGMTLFCFKAGKISRGELRASIWLCGGCPCTISTS